MPPDWIAVDWGTSNLRVWAMQGETPIRQADSDKGMGALAPHEFEPALLDLIGGWLPEGQRTLVLACGMVGARQGWAEAAYAQVPCLPFDPGNCTRVAASDPRLEVRIIPGLCQTDPPDVMRGEETQIAGFLAARPGFAGTLCLPGTHTKWVTIKAGIVQGFKTMMTGEMFALLAERSVLRHSIGTGTDAQAFAEGVALGLERAVAENLFPLRAGSLIGDLAPDAARSRLSGLLIGAEIAGASLDGNPVTIIGNDMLADHYAQALAKAGHPAETVDAEAITLKGLTLAHTILKDAAP